MMAGSEDIYHDIGAPEPAPTAAPGAGQKGCPSYVNVQLHPGAASTEAADPPEAEDPDGDGLIKPDLYDDVAARPLAPDYYNVQNAEEHGVGEHLYDDIGPTETRASVYELIQDPNQLIGQGIRCS